MSADTSPPSSSAAPRAGSSRQSATGRSNPTGPGAVRRTYYLAQPRVDELEEAIERHLENLEMLGKRLPAYVVHGEIIRAGIEREDVVTARLRRRLELDL